MIKLLYTEEMQVQDDSINNGENPKSTAPLFKEIIEDAYSNGFRGEFEILEFLHSDIIFIFDNEIEKEMCTDENFEEYCHFDTCKELIVYLEEMLNI